MVPSRVVTSAMKSGAVPTVRQCMLMEKPSMQLTGTMVMSSSLSQEIGTWHHMRSDLPMRMKIALILAIVGRSSHALLATSR